MSFAPKTPLGGGALAQGPGQVLVVGVGIHSGLGSGGGAVGHLAEREALDDVGVAVGVEVLVRASWQPGVAQRLEVLLRVARDASEVERWQSSVLPLRGVAQTR